MKSFFKLLLAAVLVVAVTIGIWGYNLFSAPKTAEMKEYFSTHQSAFVIKNTEILTALSQKTTIPAVAEENAAYLWLEIEPQPEIYKDGDPLIVRYYTHRRGIGTAAFGTGIAYMSPGFEETIYPNMEAMMNEAKQVEGFIGYSHISGNWHTFFWEAD